MSVILARLLSERFANQEEPTWVDPFLAAMRRMDVLEAREMEGKQVTAETKAAKAAAEAEAASLAEREAANRAKGKWGKKSKSKARGKVSNAAVQETVEEGLGDDVEDEVMATGVEELLKTSIELSEHQEVFPYIWITILRMQRGDWTLARETALRAAQLQPYDVNILLRLSACYGRERDFIKAHLYFERACALLSVSERATHMAKLERLREQAEDAKNNVYKEDPLEKFPLEIVINIFQFGLQDDPLLALKGSWVNQRWRNTINHDCPELWRAWTVDDKDLRGKKWATMRDLWLERARGLVDTLTLQMATEGTVRQLLASGDIPMLAPTIKRMEAEFQNMNILDHLAWYASASNFTSVETLMLSVKRPRYIWGNSQYNERIDPSNVLTCGFSVNADKLRSLELVNIGFSGFRLFGEPSRKIREPVVTVYPALTHLRVENCRFPDEYATSESNDEQQTNGRIKADVLHNTLRGTPSLKYLEVSSTWWSRRRHMLGPAMRTLIDSLQTAILPPVAVWSIDISAPNLTMLAFRVLKYDGCYTPNEVNGDRQALIPLLSESPVDVSSLPLLQTVEFISSCKDYISRLKPWISRLPNLTRLVIRDIEKFPYPAPYGKESFLKERVSDEALRLLNENPDWCPSLKNLCFESCFTPGRMLVEYVRKRSRSTTAATVTSLILEGCTKLSKKAKTALSREVAHFEIQAEYDVTKRKAMIRQFIDNRFEAIDTATEA